MQANVSIRIVQDTVHQKSFIAVEGDIQKATVEEKREFRDKLVQGIEYILGMAEPVADKLEPSIPAEATPASVAKDFEAAEKEVPECLKEPSEQTQPNEPQKAEEKTAEQPKAETKAAPQPIVDEPVMGFGKNSGMTATQILQAQGQKGREYLEKIMLPAFQKNLAKYPANQKKIDAINNAIALFEQAAPATEEVSSEEFAALVEDIERVSVEHDDPDLAAVSKLCEAFGSSYKEMVEKQDPRLKAVYDKLVELVNS